MARRKKQGLALGDDSFSLTSMIDVVFLLLIYFMYLPIQQEADMTVMLPILLPPQAETTVLPSEQKVNIMPDGSVSLNDSYIGNPQSDMELHDLASTLKRLRRSAEGAGVPIVVTIIPDGDAPHQSAMSVLDACSKAGIRQVSFSDAG